MTNENFRWLHTNFLEKSVILQRPSSDTDLIHSHEITSQHILVVSYACYIPITGLPTA